MFFLNSLVTTSLLPQLPHHLDRFFTIIAIPCFLICCLSNKTSIKRLYPYNDVRYNRNLVFPFNRAQLDTAKLRKPGIAMIKSAEKILKEPNESILLFVFPKVLHHH